MKELLKKQRVYFRSGTTKSVTFRQHQLRTLKNLLTEHETELIQAVTADFGKSEFETYATEIGLLHTEINYALRKLEKWAKPKKVPSTKINFPSRNYIVPEPYGATLIISPWNYPIQLALLPLVGAIAAGNTAVIKPSEYTPHTSSALSTVIGNWFQEEYIAVAEGAIDTNKELLALDFDYIFFTGSTYVGKIVMKAASEHLTPVTLELGGKSPCIVDHTANLKIAARRIAWGKCVNAGQTCVAPDYLLIHSSVKKPFMDEFIKAVQSFYGDDPAQSPDYPRIVNTQHFKRLSNYLANGHIISGGDSDSDELYISPTLLDDVSLDDPVMKDEIFGPVLPVLTFENIDEAIDIVHQYPKPLSLYIFTEDEQTEQLILSTCSFGGGAVNDVLIHLGNHHLPFGGVGNSGMGSYHGKTSFDTFSHYKSIIKKSTWFDLPLRYAPYKGKLKWIKKIFK